MTGVGQSGGRDRRYVWPCAVSECPGTTTKHRRRLCSKHWGYVPVQLRRALLKRVPMSPGHVELLERCVQIASNLDKRDRSAVTREDEWRADEWRRDYTYSDPEAGAGSVRDFPSGAFETNRRRH
jgi:hypothetical protein